MAEEGIDIPECNLIIRFDLYRTLIQYMQSRGRARMKNSIFAHMIERGNKEQHALADWVMESEEYLRGFCETMPEDRLLGRKRISLDRLLMTERPCKTFVTEPTGAKCSFHNCLVILARYSRSLQYEVETYFDFHFLADENPPKNTFRFKTVLPELSGINGVWGEAYPNKLLAKRSAAWETCFALRTKQLLDDNLDSIHQKKRPDNANAHLAINDRKDEYDMKIKPDFWNRECGSIPTTLYLTVIYFTSTKPLRSPYAPLILLTRSALPPLPNFPVYLEGDIQTTVSLEPGQAMQADRATMELLTSFTLAVFSDIFNKKYKRNEEQMGYWLAPIRSGQIISEDRNTLFDVSLLRKVHQAGGERTTWVSGTSPANWLGEFLVDPWSGQYRYFCQSVFPGATWDSPIPPGVKKRPSGSQNILSFTSSLFSKSEGKKKLLSNADNSQPIFEVEMAHLRRNVLDKMTDQEKAFSSYAQVAPQPLEVSHLGCAIARTCFAFPAIMSRLDSYLIVLEAFRKLDLKIPAELALEAFTKDSDNSEDFKEQQIQPQRGMGKNYERLEFIGDSLLKMTTTIMVYIRYAASILVQIRDSLTPADIQCRTNSAFTRDE